MPAIVRIVLVVLLLAGAAAPAAAERRVALLIAAERHDPLRPLANPRRDVVALRGVLERLDFEVWVETDRTLVRLRRALEDFRSDAAGADVALVRFAGHGTEVGGGNLLLPVDASAESHEALRAGALPLEELAAVAREVAGSVLILVDACRDAPFGEGAEGTRAAERPDPGGAAVRPGLGRMGRADGVLYAFAAAPGEVAADGPAGGNAPFAAALQRHLGTDGVEIRSALTLVQQDVCDRTRRAQLPYIESGLPRLFFATTTGNLSERDRLLQAMADLSGDHRAQIERIVAARAMPLAPLYAAFLSAGLDRLGWEERERRLAEAAAAWAAHHERLRGLESFDARVAGALAAYAEGLGIRLRLARDFPAVVAFRLDVVVSRFNMAQVTGAPVRRLMGAPGNLERLRAEGLLPPDREGWLAIARAELAGHGWQAAAAR